MIGKYVNLTSGKGLSSAFFIILATTFLLTGCGAGGSGSSDSQGTGSIGFSVKWDRSAGTRTADPRYGVDDCSDVDSVSAAVYSEDGSLLQTGGPWSCTDGEGVITDVPAGYNVRVGVTGLYDAMALYYGESTGTFYLEAGASVDAGVITAGSFVPTLLSPADGTAVAPSALTLAWNQVTGADRYRVTINDGEGGAILTMTVNASATPSCQPDTSSLTQNMTYNWHVQAIDGAGNESVDSASRGFTISTNLLIASIDAPPSNYQIRDGTSLTFSASVTDAASNPLTTSDLTSIIWTSSLDGVIGNQLSFSTTSLSLGNHNITLDVVATSGFSGTSTVAIQVVNNLPPVAEILFPAINYDQNVNSSLTCSGQAIDPDPEDGNITSSAQLAWEIVEDANTTHMTSGTGTSFYIDYMYFNYITGGYTITFRATDRFSLTDTDSVSINVVP